MQFHIMSSTTSTPLHRLALLTLTLLRFILLTSLSLTLRILISLLSYTLTSFLTTIIITANLLIIGIILVYKFTRYLEFITLSTCTLLIHASWYIFNNPQNLQIVLAERIRMLSSLVRVGFVQFLAETIQSVALSISSIEALMLGVNDAVASVVSETGVVVYALVCHWRSQARYVFIGTKAIVWYGIHLLAVGLFGFGFV